MGIRRKTVIIATAAALLATLGLVTACGASERGQNAPKKAERDTAPALIINMPQGFRNIAFKCIGPNGAYETSRGDWASAGEKGPELPSSLSMVPNDPNCKPGAVPGAVQVNPGAGTPTR